MQNRVILISVHPHYADKIVSGEKRIEFRRCWATQPISEIVIYATSPIQRVVAIARVKKVTQASPSKLWELSKKVGGGISREKLFVYLSGKKEAFGVELTAVRSMKKILSPKEVFGDKFHPPQSFCYLTEDDLVSLKQYLK
jgi:predicted transcriptional regulator